MSNMIGGVKMSKKSALIKYIALILALAFILVALIPILARGA